MKKIRTAVMIVQGGLGNQLFQYSLGYLLTEMGFEVCYNHQWFNTSYAAAMARTPWLPILFAGNINECSAFDYFDSYLRQRRYASRIYERFQFPGKRKLITDCGEIDRNFLKLLPSGRFIFEGYWQRRGLIEDISDRLRPHILTSLLRLHTQKSEYSATLSPENTVIVHVRRGDYFATEATRKIYGCCPPEFYQEGFDYFRRRQPSVKFLVFSDDPEWCKNEWQQEKSVIIASSNIQNPVSDLALMSQFKNFLIPNSTFSWWAAWLSNPAPENIFCPLHWLPVKNACIDLIDPRWRTSELAVRACD